MTQNRPASPQSCISNINPVVSAKIENMIQKIEYAETIFGGTNKVKRIIVEEIISKIGRASCRERV